MEIQILPKPAYLEPSPLGTKEYWDTLYSNEIANHAADPSDVGTIWFDDSAAEDTLLAFLHSPALALSATHTSFLDLGTGNGHFLLRLQEPFPRDEEEEEGGGEPEPEPAHEHEHATTISGLRRDGGRGRGGGGFTGRMVGTDYSLQSIEFAHRIAASHASSHPPPPPSSASSSTCAPQEIEFLHLDIMAPTSAPALLTGPNADGYDVVLDKGTFDAVCLDGGLLLSGEGEGEGGGGADGDGDWDDVYGDAAEERAAAGSGGSSGRRRSGSASTKKKRLCEFYKDRILPLVRDGGVFLVTSCNWTEEELRSWFEGNDGSAGEGAAPAAGGGRLVFETGLKYRTFRFGGREGQSISSVCFRKRGE